MGQNTNLVDDGNSCTDQQGENDDVNALAQAFRDGHEEIAEADRGAFNISKGSGIDQHPAIGARNALVGASGNEMGQHRHDGDNEGQDHKRMRNFKFFLWLCHGRHPLSF